MFIFENNLIKQEAVFMYDKHSSLSYAPKNPANLVITKSWSNSNTKDYNEQSPLFYLFYAQR